MMLSLIAVIVAPESPKFLYSQRKGEKLRKSFTKIMQFNGRDEVFDYVFEFEVKHE